MLKENVIPPSKVGSSIVIPSQTLSEEFPYFTLGHTLSKEFPYSTLSCTLSEEFPYSTLSLRPRVEYVIYLPQRESIRILRDFLRAKPKGNPAEFLYLPNVDWWYIILFQKLFHEYITYCMKSKVKV